MPVIDVKNVNVTYRVLMNNAGSLKELFRDAVKGKARVIDYVALQDISFTVEKALQFLVEMVQANQLFLKFLQVFCLQQKALQRLMERSHR
jgi:hypothetical protein